MTVLLGNRQDVLTVCWLDPAGDQVSRAVDVTSVAQVWFDSFG
jgi:hypothetical protein